VLFQEGALEGGAEDVMAVLNLVDGRGELAAHAAIEARAEDLSEKAYGLNQLRYDLRKLKGHRLIERDGSRYAYRLSQKGGTRSICAPRRRVGVVSRSPDLPHEQASTITARRASPVLAGGTACLCQSGKENSLTESALDTVGWAASRSLLERR
jgi:hypothetical protein